MLQLQAADGVGGTAADHVELALEGIGDHHVGAAADEDLADHRLLGLDRGRHGHRRIGRHVAPAQDDLAFGTDGTLDLFLAGETGGVFLGQEDHAHAVIAGGRQGHALLGHLFAEQGVRNLDQDAGTVALQRVGTHGTPVVQILQDFETLLNDLVGFVALDMCNETDTTGVMFVGGVVQALLQGKIHLVFPRHNTHRHSHSCSTGPSNCGKPPRPNRQKKPAHRSAGYSDPDEETVQTHWARL